MQIFVISPEPIDTAKILDDLRLRKMVIEQAQLICDRLPGSPYKPYNPNCGLSKWVHLNQVNFNWAVKNLQTLIEENLYRFNRYIGRTMEVLRYVQRFTTLEPDLPEQFYNESFYETDENVFEAYKKTLIFKWLNDKKKPTWTKRETPDFYLNYLTMN